MKYAMILPNGAADEPIVALDGRTPLEAADTPHMDSAARGGRVGRVVTVPPGYAPDSDVATMALFGYDPTVFHDGRAPLEATARGIPVGDDELVFRCNFVTVVDGLMEDFTAGHITQAETQRLVADLNGLVGSHACRFHSGVSYRGLMVASCPAGAKPICTPPHGIPSKPVASHLPKGPQAEWVVDIMDRARAMLAVHDVNLVRRDMGENPATDIWLWGQGRPRSFESFAKRFDLSAACIAGVDLVRGLVVSAGMTAVDVPGATGYLDTDYEAKGAAAACALDEFDLVICHIEAPDEAGHLGDAEAKVSAIERIDRHIVGPVLDKLRSFDEWRILIAPDHPTPVERRVHTAEAPPFCMAGTGVQSIQERSFTESAAKESDLLVDPGHELMEYFLRS